jgi:hypothetical protein
VLNPSWSPSDVILLFSSFSIFATIASFLVISSSILMRCPFNSRSQASFPSPLTAFLISSNRDESICVYDGPSDPVGAGPNLASSGLKAMAMLLSLTSAGAPSSRAMISSTCTRSVSFTLFERRRFWISCFFWARFSWMSRCFQRMKERLSTFGWTARRRNQLFERGTGAGEGGLPSISLHTRR